MKKLIALVWGALWAGCASSHTPQLLSVRVEAFARSESRLEGTYVLLPSKEAEGHARHELLQVMAFIDQSLGDRGLRKAENQEVADFAVFAHFGVTTRPITRAREELIFSQRVVAPKFGPGPYSIRYEPVGFMTHEITRSVGSSFLVLTVYDLRALRSSNESRVIWEIGASCDTKGSSIVRSVPAMLSASVGRFGASSKPVEVRLVNVGEGKWQVRGTVELPVSIKETKAAQPGATDNPDDAQRLREDH